MRHGRTILSLAICGALALMLGACGANESNGDGSSSSATETTEKSSGEALLPGGDLSEYESELEHNAFVTDLTSDVSAFTYEEPSGWDKETTEDYVVYKKTDGDDLLAIIFVGQSNEDHAKDKTDMSRLCSNAYVAYTGGFAWGDDCDVEDENEKRGYAGVPDDPASDTCYIDGCAVREEDVTITGHPYFSDCKGSMLSIGAADAELTAGLISCDSEYEECREDFLKLVGSVHVTEEQLAKVQELLGEEPVVGNTFSGDSIEDICAKADGSSSEQVSTTDGEQQYGAGKYKVGTDIPAGEYKLIANGGASGYWEVTDSSAPDADIVGNENFTGSTYVTVSDGQYLKLEDCTAVPA